MNQEEIEKRAEFIAEFYRIAQVAKDNGIAKEDLLREVEDAYSEEEEA